VADIAENLTTLNAQWLASNLIEARNTHDVIGFIGGPPCPDFSVAGKNRGKHGENGKLSDTYIELIVRNRPDFFLFENVKGLYRTAKHREFFESIKLKLANAGFLLTERLINSLEYGVPQDRERIILIGFHKSILTDFGFRVNGSHLLHNFDWKRNTVYDIETILNSRWPKIEAFAEDSQLPCPPNLIKQLTVQHWFQKNDVLNHPNAHHHFQPRAGLTKFLTIGEGDDSRKSSKRLHRWRYSPTAAYGNNEVHLHPYKARRISAAEALAIQSLPFDFEIPDSISLSDMFKTIGNGVPYLAAKGLAENIHSFIFDNNNKDTSEPHGKTDRHQYSRLCQPVA
jgi:DNA (cytosine-5)-methyltransferase 1